MCRFGEPAADPSLWIAEPPCGSDIYTTSLMKNWNVPHHLCSSASVTGPPRQGLCRSPGMSLGNSQIRDSLIALLHQLRQGMSLQGRPPCRRLVRAQSAVAREQPASCSRSKPQPLDTERSAWEHSLPSGLGSGLPSTCRETEAAWSIQRSTDFKIR